MNLAAAAKAAVAETFLNRGAPPANRTAAGMSATATDTRGKYVSQVDVNNGIITITYGGTEVNAAILNATLAITPYITADNSVAWRCGNAGAPGGLTTTMGNVTHTGGTLANVAMNKYLPAACRP
jgi:type IV pilus assembly protein PilA